MPGGAARQSGLSSCFEEIELRLRWLEFTEHSPLGYMQRAPLRYSAGKGQGSNGGNYLRQERNPPPNNHKTIRGYVSLNPPPAPHLGISVSSFVNEGTWLRLNFGCACELAPWTVTQEGGGPSLQGQHSGLLECSPGICTFNAHPPTPPLLTAPLGQLPTLPARGSPGGKLMAFAGGEREGGPDSGKPPIHPDPTQKGIRARHPPRNSRSTQMLRSHSQNQRTCPSRARDGRAPRGGSQLRRRRQRLPGSAAAAESGKARAPGGIRAWPIDGELAAAKGPGGKGQAGCRVSGRGQGTYMCSHPRDQQNPIETHPSAGATAGPPPVSVLRDRH